MICDECGLPMHWRCTNNETNIIKYKCPVCGKIKSEKKEPVKVEKKITIKKKHNKFSEPKHYHSTSNGYEVKKYVNGKQTYFCRTKTEKEAKKIVELLKECDWDKSQLQRIKKEVMG